MSTASAPLEIGHVSLVVRDLPRVASFYRDMIGLEEIARDGNTLQLGVAGHVLIELRGAPGARQGTAREAGLFHTAFLLPGRSDLAAWLLHASDAGLELQGASDHLVSEAIYLADPEGNGIEVYADRPRSTWHGPDGRIRMATERLDLAALARDARAPWAGAPEGSTIGHVHLQVGDVPAAATFLADVLGLPVMARYPGASFHGAGGYHHHIAANAWHSKGAGARNLPATGLAELTLRADTLTLAALEVRAGSTRLTDPWGTPIIILPKAA